MFPEKFLKRETNQDFLIKYCKDEKQEIIRFEKVSKLLMRKQMVAPLEISKKYNMKAEMFDQTSNYDTGRTKDRRMRNII